MPNNNFSSMDKFYLKKKIKKKCYSVEVPTATLSQALQTIFIFANVLVKNKHMETSLEEAMCVHICLFVRLSVLKKE